MDSKHLEPILQEFIQTYELLGKTARHVTIFGSARTKNNDKVYQDVEMMAKKLAENGHNIATGGGYGSMIAANKGAQEAGGLSIGYSIQLPFEKSGNEFLDIHSNHGYFASRKWFLITRASAIIGTPGGFGTVEEVTEAICLKQCKKITRPMPIVLVGKRYWQGLLDWMEIMDEDGYISNEDHDLFLITDDINEAISYIENGLDDDDIVNLNIEKTKRQV